MDNEEKTKKEFLSGAMSSRKDDKICKTYGQLKSERKYINNRITEYENKNKYRIV